MNTAFKVTLVFAALNTVPLVITQAFGEISTNGRCASMSVYVARSGHRWRSVDLINIITHVLPHSPGNNSTKVRLSAVRVTQEAEEEAIMSKLIFLVAAVACIVQCE